MSNTEAAAPASSVNLCKGLLLGCLVALSAAACGQRGPLYLPEQQAAPGAEASATEQAGEPDEEPGDETDGAAESPADGSLSA